MAQMCGATAMKYYLPALFEALGLSHRVSLLAGGIESTMKIGCTLVDMLIIDRIGRRITLTAGAAVMAVSMLVGNFSPYLVTNVDLCRSTAPCRRYILEILTGLLTTCVLSLCSPILLDTAWALDLQLGFTARR
jgi:MFS family permease